MSGFYFECGLGAIQFKFLGGVLLYSKIFSLQISWFRFKFLAISFAFSISSGVIDDDFSK